MQLLSLLLFATHAAALTSKTIFNKLDVCPPTDKLSQLTKLEDAQDPRTCYVECATSLTCSVVYRSGGICYFGTSEQQSSFFTLAVSPNTEPCVSFAKGVTSKLVVLFDFRKGFTNLISPGTYDATPHGSVSRDDQGANFPGSKADYIEVDTRSGSLISTYLDYPSNFSFYAKVVRQGQYQTSYHCLFNCANDNANNMATFGDRNKKAFVEHQFLSLSSYPDNCETRESGDLFSSNALQAISLGAVFQGKSLSNFYVNGSSQATGNDMAWGPYALPNCLRLGYFKDAQVVLKGRMICYAIAKAALSTAEFQQLDQLCTR